MSMTKTDLDKNRGSKINGKIGAGGIPDRFGSEKSSKNN